MKVEIIISTINQTSSNPTGGNNRTFLAYKAKSLGCLVRTEVFMISIGCKCSLLAIISD